MYQKALMIILCMAMLTLAGCGNAPMEPTPTVDSVPMDDIGKAEGETPAPTAVPSTPTPTKEPDTIQRIVDGLTLDQKIGQIMMVGFEGTTLNEHAKSMINDYHVGGFIFFKRNMKSVSQTVSLVNALRVANRPKPFPIFISLDEEGGRVARIPNAITQTPTARTIGKRKDEAYAKKIGEVIGLKCKKFGFNMDFAPVLDINSNPDNPIIGDRAFGETIKTVSTSGIPVMQGIQEQGVIPVVKHFPGHGDTSVDSHLGLPKVGNSLSRLKEFELVPFQSAIDKGADVVLVAHILFPEIDGDNPATFSQKIVTDILRDDMGFEGVICTDDMEMGAITENYTMEDAAVRAFKAGNDLLLICHTEDKQIAAFNAINKAVQSGDIPMERLDESVYRILKLKKKYGLTDKPIDAVSTTKVNDAIAKILG